MATTKDYRLGEFTFPRGWFMIAEATELDTHKPLSVRFFGQDFALYRGRETGKDTFRAFLARMNRCYRERLENIVVCASEDGRNASAEYVVHGQYLVADEGLPPAHGQGYVLPGGAFFDIRDGRIARVTNYYNLEDWIRQVSV